MHRSFNNHSPSRQQGERLHSKEVQTRGNNIMGAIKSVEGDIRHKLDLQAQKKRSLNSIKEDMNLKLAEVDQAEQEIEATIAKVEEMKRHQTRGQSIEREPYKRHSELVARAGLNSWKLRVKTIEKTHLEHEILENRQRSTS